MSHELNPVDPEKGMLDSQPMQVSYNGDVKALLPTLDISLPSKEKDPAVTTTAKEVVTTTKPSKPPPKPKKQVSKWILWTLWFNTYRYMVFPFKRKRMLSPSQEIFHLLFWSEHDWPCLGGHRTFSLWRQILWCLGCGKFQHSYFDAQ